jgi:hypothetical protein
MGPLEVLIPLGAFSMFGFICWVIADAFRRRQQLRTAAEFNHKLLDKMTSTQELGAFLQSDGGARLMATLTAPNPVAGPHVRILRAVQSGFVLLSLGLGLFVLAARRQLWVDVEAQDGVLFTATIATSLGVGLLVSAAAAYAMSRHLGLLRGGAGANTVQGLS